jgi:hypothetical protein
VEGYDGCDGDEREEPPPAEPHEAEHERQADGGDGQSRDEGREAH